MIASRRLAIFTICSNNYLPMAKVLLNSARGHHPEADVFLALADRVVDIDGLYDPTWTVIEAEQLDIPEFPSFAFRYDIMEFNTATKPFVFSHLLEERGYDDVIYFDPDIEVYRPLSGVLERLRGGCSFVLIPHIVKPLEVADEPNDISIMRAGIYNLGFLAVRRCEESANIIQWWARRLRYQCISAQEQGIFVDQKFMDLVPGFARNIHISADPSLNVAYWNLSQREVRYDEGSWTVDNCPLTFFHFSGFDPAHPTKLSKYTARFDGTMSVALQRLVDSYAKKIVANGYGSLPRGAYAYARFKSGATIHPFIRQMFCSKQKDWPTDPFWTYENFLDEPSPEIPQHDPAFIITNLMKYVHDNVPHLNRHLDLANPGHAREMVRWFVFRAVHDIELHPLLAMPAAARMARTTKTRKYTYEDGGQRPDVTIVGYLRADSGVGEAARHTLRALSDAKLKVEGLDIELNVASTRKDDSCARHLVAKGTGRVHVVHVNADQLPAVLEHVGDRLSGDAVRVSVPFWELSRVPDVWLKAFDRVDEIWAPTRFVQNALLHTIDKPIVHMPIAVDVPFVQRRRRSHFGLPDDAFLFFFAFDFLSFIDRKNPYGTVAAFRLFRKRSRGGRAVLVVKSMNGCLAPEKLAEFQREIAGHADIVLIDKIMTHEETLELIAVVDCVVSLHRSEGFGLLVAEAMLLGKPVVATDYSATIELLSPLTGFPVDCKLIPVLEDQYPFGKDQVWADPDVTHAAWHMAQIFDSPSSEAVRATVARASETVRRKHSRNRVGSLLALRLSQLLS
jgi:glycosyltransferase involved in cell wall biosynthesis